MSKTYKETRKTFHSKTNFFIYWKLVRLENILSDNAYPLIFRLNDCGWQFKLDSHEHKVYRAYQDGDELRRLICWLKMNILKVDRQNSVLSREHIEYVQKLLPKIKDCIERCMRYNYLRRGNKIMNVAYMESYINKLNKV